jgi:hypothetical protein
MLKLELVLQLSKNIVEARANGFVISEQVKKDFNEVVLLTTIP